MNLAQLERARKGNPKLRDLCEIPGCPKKATHERSLARDYFSMFCERHWINNLHLHEESRLLYTRRGWWDK